MVFRKFLVPVLAIGVLNAPLVSAHAADLDGVYVDDANFVTPAELGSGWYIRGELGLNLNGQHNVGMSSANMEFFNQNIMDKTHLSVGAGYQFNRFFRGELNIGRLMGTDWESTRLMSNAEILAAYGSTTDPNPCNGWVEIADPILGAVRVDGVIDNCIEKDIVEYDTTYVMANGWVDLGNYHGFTPFIGGGIGLGRVAWRQEVDAIECIPRAADVVAEGCSAYGVADQPGANEPYSQPGDVDEGVGYRIGYEIGAGVAYDVSSNTKMELSYKYKNFGAGGVDYSGVGPTGLALAESGFGVHQVNLGLRYSFW